jgi:hypothetical protein
MRPADINLPAPLVPVDCDLRDFAFMPLDVVRLRDSDLAVTAEADEFRCAVLLWCASWHQVPAASLPDDDKILAQYAGYGRVVKEWIKVRTGALRGWVKCADGRLYHPVVAEKANEAWLAKLRQRLKTECARIKKHNERHGTKLPFPEFDAWLSLGCPVGQPLFVPSDKPAMSPGQTDDVTGENHSKGQGEGQGQLTTNSETSSQAATEGGSGDDGRDHPSQPAKRSRNVQISMLLNAQGVTTTAQNPIVAVTWAQDDRVTDTVLNAAIVKAKVALDKQGRGSEVSVAYLEPIVAQQLAAPPVLAHAGTPGRPEKFNPTAYVNRNRIKP